MSIPRPTTPPFPHPDTDPGCYRPPTVRDAWSMMGILSPGLAVPALLGYGGAWPLSWALLSGGFLLLIMVALAFGGVWLERRECAAHRARQWAKYEASQAEWAAYQAEQERHL